MEADNQKLSHRLNRVIGQIEAIRKKLEAEESSSGDEFTQGGCLETMHQLKAARNALKKFAEAYLQLHIHKCMKEDRPMKGMENGLKEAVKAAIDL